MKPKRQSDRDCSVGKAEARDVKREVKPVLKVRRLRLRGKAGGPLIGRFDPRLLQCTCRSVLRQDIYIYQRV